MSQEKSFSEMIQEWACSDLKTIVLPEGGDQRVLRAAKIITAGKIARLTLLGGEGKIRASLAELGLDADEVKIINPQKSDKAEEYAKRFYELRKAKGVTAEQAHELVRDPMYFGTMMVKCGDVDGMVAGAVRRTPDTIRPALQIIKAAKWVDTVSGAFFICKDKRTYLFADCAVVANPDAEQLADIAMSSVHTAGQFGIKPCIAMLSYSTKSSAPGSAGKKVVEATAIAKEKISSRFGSDVPIDGELQFDAAFVPEVAKRKCPDSPVGGRANVFIFPNLEASNIVYKAVQRFSGADAYGPMLQGLAKPVNDLSRGCSAEDIVATVAITAVQAQDVDTAGK